MQFTDKVTVDGTRITNDGYLAASARIARTGVQYYMGMEIDPKNEHGLRDRMSVGVYRSEAEVFAKDSLSTLAHKPLTNNHPPVAVTIYSSLGSRYAAARQPQNGWKPGGSFLATSESHENTFPSRAKCSGR